MKKILGTIVSGSLSQGLIMRIDKSASLDDLKTGKFVALAGKTYTFFALITDICLEVTHPDILVHPPDIKETLLLRQLKNRSMYATAQLKPMVMLDSKQSIAPVKTIPTHFTTVYEASAQDIAHIFGDAQDKSRRYFHIGAPLDMDTPVCINLERLSERSSGIFGKTGTGKTFLTRLLLAGLIHQEKAVLLIFDMHSEYGTQARTEGTGTSFVKGLKTLFPDRIVTFSLDPQSTRRRASAPDVEIILSYQNIHVEDIISLQEELNLHPTALEAAYLVFARYKQHWLEVLLAQEDIKTFAQDIGAHPESIAALYRKLKRIEHFSFFKTNVHPKHSVIDQIIEYIDRGISINIEFGNYASPFCYLLIANIITRRIHKQYTIKTERFLGSQKKEDQPKHLMICIEEAHKFLNPTAARQTIFGTISREMRKYFVSLLVVDQRPSGIDQEVMSQIGTKIIAQLSDEKDIQAVLVGTHNSSTLRSVLATLDTKQQALILGHAVPMPIVIQTRLYDEAFYQTMSCVSKKNIDQAIKELF